MSEPLSATHADLMKARKLWEIVQEEYTADAERAIAMQLAAEREATLAPIRELCHNIQRVIETMDWSAKAPCAGVLDSVVQVLRKTLPS